MLKEKKEKNWLLSIIKFMRDKLKELIKKIFARDLSFNQRLDKEIKELQEKLGSGELSEEEFARALERLTALQDLKLRLQMAVVGWIVTMFAEMFGVELAAAVEASTEKEDKKAEKTSLKEEAIKEVHKDVEIKVDEREKPKVPVFLFEISPGFVRPVVLSKPELDLLSKPIMPSIFKEVINNENREETKPKVEEDKKAKPEKKPVASGIKFDSKDVKGIGFDKWRSNTNVNERGTTPPTNGQGNKLDNEKKNESASCAESRLNGSVNKEIKSTNEQGNFDAKLAKKVANLKIGVWNGAENEGSVNDAQPPGGLTNDVKVEKCVEGQSVGKNVSTLLRG